MYIFSVGESFVAWKYMVVALGEYLFVKFFLVVFMAISRMYCFYQIKKLCKKKKNLGKKKLKLLIRFNKVKYWPKLKLGIPGKAGRRNSVTKVKFDEKGFPIFKAYYTVKLRRKDFHKTRDQHFYIANKMIYQEILTKSRLRAKFSKQEIKKFSQGNTPSKYTWHHHQDGVTLQEVLTKYHERFRHRGGMSKIKE